MNTLKIILILLILIIIGLFIFYSPIVSQQKTSQQEAEKAAYLPGEVLVKFKPDTPRHIIEAFKKELNISGESYTESIALYHWKGNFQTLRAIERLKKSPHVLYAEPNWRVRIE